MQFSSSSMRLFTLAALTAIPGSSAFVAPNVWSPRGIAFVPSSELQPPTSTSINVGKLIDTDSDIEIGKFLEKLDVFSKGKDTVRTLKNLDKALEALEDIEDLDPEDDADDKETEEILDMALRALDDISTDDIARDTGIAATETRSILDSAKNIIKSLIIYYFENSNPETMGFDTYAAHDEVS